MPLGGAELLIIALLIFFFFGARRLPEFGRSLGAGMREFKHSVKTRGEESDESDEAPEPTRASLPTTTGSTAAGAQTHDGADRATS